MQNKHLAVINAGSSSIKFAVYEFNTGFKESLNGYIENLQTAPSLKIFDAKHTLIKQESFPANCGYEYFYDLLFSIFESYNFKLSAVGHRIVHGGDFFHRPVVITQSIIEQLKTLIPFAPLHQPHNIQAVDSILKLDPKLPQVACFDTAFHHTHPPIANQFGLPQALTQAGIRRYGFHGLSYEYILQTIKKINPNKANGRIIVAHLGSGASMCAIKNGESIDSTMGFTALDGLMMGTRCGSLDPGVILYLLQQKNMSSDGIQDLLYKQSGLLGVSGISSDMRILLESPHSAAKEAVDLFVYRIRRELGALTAVLGGLDMLVFTAGIGEHAWQIREAVCVNSQWLGMQIDQDLNKASKSIISHLNSQVEIHVISTNEELIIANHSAQLLKKDL